MSSPASEIIVSTEPPPSHPVQTVSEPAEAVEPEEMPVDAPLPLSTESASKKSFKRK
jgi:hypothetical protein